ncbi:T9SS type A sorting domain-containing protein [bacterium]|nr:T9SS type A sorting domain-containing protein [bacterium]
MKERISRKGYAGAIRTATRNSVFFLLLILCASVLPATAQQEHRSTVSPAGETARAPGLSLSWTLGDLATGYYRTPTMQYREGFQSAHLRVTVVEALPEAWNVEVYPNPTQSGLSVDLGTQHPVRALTLYDLSGRELRTLPVEPAARQAQLQLDELPSGTYILRVSDAQGRPAGSYQIRKVH